MLITNPEIMKHRKQRTLFLGPLVCGPNFILAQSKLSNLKRTTTPEQRRCNETIPRTNIYILFTIDCLHFIVICNLYCKTKVNRRLPCKKREYYLAVLKLIPRSQLLHGCCRLSCQIYGRGYTTTIAYKMFIILLHAMLSRKKKTPSFCSLFHPITCQLPTLSCLRMKKGELIRQISFIPCRIFIPRFVFTICLLLILIMF